MRVLVTGGAGFLGSHLVDALVERGDDVVVVDNLRRGRLSHIQGHLKRKAIRFREADIRDFPTVVEATSGAEVVYHLAAQSNVMGAIRDVDYSFSTNVVGTFNVLKAAGAQGVRRMVFSSSREIYGEPERTPVPETAPFAPKNPYGASKMAGEAYCRAWQASGGLDCQVLRFANLYGPRDRDRVIPLWLGRVRAGQDLELYGGQQVLDLVWVGQAVDTLLAAATCENEGPINVGTGIGTRLEDLAKQIVALTGGRVGLRYLPARSVEVVRFVADVGKMQRVLEIVPPERPLEQLKLMVEGGW